MGVAEDDERLGRLLRLIRQREGRTQKDLARAASVPVIDLRRIESGQVGTVRVDRVRRAFAELDGRARIIAWWRGAAADRLLDERHAAIVERVLRLLSARGWEVRVEVTFSEWGERGSIDILAGLKARLAVGVFEIKSDIGSVEETNRLLGIKERLAPKLAEGEFGWRPVHVARVLVLPAEMRLRRLVERHGQTMDAAYPARSREVRAWLRQPEGKLRGLWFVSEARTTRTNSG